VLTKEQLYKAILFANEPAPGEFKGNRICAIIWLHKGKEAFMEYVKDYGAWLPEIGDFAYGVIHGAYKAKKILQEHLYGEA